MVFSNAEWLDRNISIGVAALHSARFPLISPAGKLAVMPLVDPAQGKRSFMRVVDGGYFDNSGAATLRAFLNEAPWRQVSVPEKLPVVRINGNDQGPDPRCPRAFEAYKEIFPLVATPKDDEDSPAEGWSGIKAFIKMREAQSHSKAF